MKPTETERTSQGDAIQRAAEACGMTRADYFAAALAPHAAAERRDLDAFRAMGPRARAELARRDPLMVRELRAALARPAAPVRSTARPRAARRVRTSTRAPAVATASSDDAPPKPAPVSRWPWVEAPQAVLVGWLGRAGWVRLDVDRWLDPSPRPGRPRRCSTARAVARQHARVRRAQGMAPSFVIRGGA